MEIISIDEFETLAASNAWRHEQNHEILDRCYDLIEEWDSETNSKRERTTFYVLGWAAKTSTLQDIKITYAECFGYTENMPNSLSTEPDQEFDKGWVVESVAVIDDKGDEIPAHELALYLDYRFSSIDYSVLKIKETIVNTEIDNDTDTDNEGMEKIIIELNNEPGIRFTGELLAQVSSSTNQASSRYSGQPGRWTELALYKTKGGKFVCHQIGHTSLQGEHDRYSGKVCETLDEVMAFFGHRWLAKELYNKANIDDSIEVE